MIRREVRIGDAGPQWLLISQIEHARLSGVLAKRAIGRFPGSDTAGEHGQLAGVRDELLWAIEHHDDGWAEWEKHPGLDHQLHRPVAFTEMPQDEQIRIWSGSIRAAEDFGPLAAWCVAGHFHFLETQLDDNPSDRTWTEEVDRCRADWLAEWQSVDPTLHTAELAAEAFLWIQSFDVASLSLCCCAPLAVERLDTCSEDNLFQQDGLVVAVHTAEPSDQSRSPTATIVPWLFDVPQFEVSAAGHLVPAREYDSTEELLAARQPFTARWTLVAAIE